jgi:hypothetical protein
LLKIPLPLLSRLAHRLPFGFKLINQVAESAGNTAEELVQDGSKETERSPLEFMTTTVEEEGKCQRVSSIMSRDFTKGELQEG